MKLKIPGITLMIGIPLVLSGCGLWGDTQPSDNKQSKGKNDINLVDEDQPLENKKSDNKKSDNKKDESESSTSKKEQSKAETVEKQLFLLDKNGMVVPQTVMLPKTRSVAKQSLKYLVKDGPVSNMLPNGFQAVLPAGTQVIGANLEDQTLTVNFSKQFKKYKSKNEQKILQAVTWTATQFDNINHLKIRVNGNEQKTMPVNDTPIGEDGASREDGINEQTTGQVADITDSQAMTLYFPAQAGDKSYYVPVTQRTDDNDRKITATVKELIKGPTQTGLVGRFSDNTSLKGEPKIKDGVVTLNFNKALLSSTKKKVISREALNSLVLSLTAQDGIQKVAIQVNGKTTIKNEDGKKLSEPVARPKQVNKVGI